MNTPNPQVISISSHVMHLFGEGMEQGRMQTCEYAVAWANGAQDIEVTSLTFAHKGQRIPKMTFECMVNIIAGGNCVETIHVRLTASAFWVSG